ncbi:MAG: hypothetical protein H7Z41_19265, partial [Cytophagales bacterium]|nr:hypothetical protein [Armatimonadota bacterium]
MPITVWITTSHTQCGPEDPDAYLFIHVERSRQKLTHPPHPQYARYALATSPREAEIILFIEPHGRKTADYVTRLLGNALI